MSTNVIGTRKKQVFRLKKENSASLTVTSEKIQQYIFVIRGEKVILDAHLAILYGVQTRVLVQAVKRNIDRFPNDFMLQLTKEESQILRSQIVISRKF